MAAESEKTEKLNVEKKRDTKDLKIKREREEEKEEVRRVVGEEPARSGSGSFHSRPDLQL
jgi:hypothetical protein